MKQKQRWGMKANVCDSTGKGNLSRVNDSTEMGDGHRGLCLHTDGGEKQQSSTRRAVICDFMETGERKQIIVTSRRRKQMSMTSQRWGTACWCLWLHWIGDKGRICDFSEVGDGGKCLWRHRVRLWRDISCLTKGSYCSVIPQQLKESIISLFQVFLTIVNIFHWLCSYREIQRLLPTLPRQITSVKMLE